MNRRSLLLLAVAASAAASLLSACIGNDPIDSTTAPPVPNFRSGVIPALQAKTCTSVSCHGSTNVALNGGVMMNAVDPSGMWMTLTQIPGTDGAIVVDTTNAASSELLTKPQSGTPGGHVGGTGLWGPSGSGAAQYNTVLGWIQSGAPNN